jgi:hypothetical protein
MGVDYEIVFKNKKKSNKMETYGRDYVFVYMLDI